MAKKKPQAQDAKRHQLNLRLHPDIRAQLDILCARNASDLSEEIRIAVRKHLKDNDLWPPPAVK